MNSAFGPEDLNKLDRATVIVWRSIRRGSHHPPPTELKDKVRKKVAQIAESGGTVEDPSALAAKAVKELKDDQPAACVPLTSLLMPMPRRSPVV